MFKRSVALTALSLSAAGAMLPSVARANFPGQNGQIAFAHAKYDKRAKDFGYMGVGSLFTMFPDGSDVSALPADPDYDDFEPAWSPDGTMLAYASIGAPKYTGIYSTPPQATDPVLLAKAEFPDAPAWSPDGRSVAYVDYAKGILTVAAAKGSRPQLTVPNAKNVEVAAPVFAPNGEAIFYSRTKLGKNGRSVSSEIWTADPGGANARKLLGGAGAQMFSMEPDVSPDGKQLVFVGYDRNKPSGLWVANVDGSGLRKLASSSSAKFYTGPSWSPDGTKIAAALQRSSVKLGGSIVTIDLATGTRTTVRSGRKQYMGTVSWQPVPPQPTVG